MEIKNVLVIDDEPDIRELLEITLARMDLNTVSTHNVISAKEALAKQTFDLCLTDMRLPDGDGLDIVEFIQTQYPGLPVAVITAYGNVETAVQALKLGAFDYVSKPVDLNLLRQLVQTALKLTSPPSTALPSTPTSKLLGESSTIKALHKTIMKVARSQAPLYIRGESGSGKELVAREIHGTSPRAEQAFIAINCGAIPAELMESEFFGHKKGSFTGATSDKEGLFMAASGGTLFLDEVADLPLNMQVKLLRAIQERAIKPIGEQREQSVDIRIISATHKNLALEVSAGRFREDLFYRLNVIEINVPPLRDRRDDIPLLANHFLEKVAKDWNTHKKQLSPATVESLREYRFPGNVRELENILERSITLSEGDIITPADLALPQEKQPTQHASTNDNLVNTLADQERTAIINALETTRWNKTAAAKQLGMTLRQLRYRLTKFDID
jgi:two-component system response regulator PilR (NtrC family)